MSDTDKLINRLNSNCDHLKMSDSGHHCYRCEAATALREQQAEIQLLRKALDDLVALKDYRDWHGKTPEYLEKKPAAWQQAREVLEAPN